MKKPQNFLEAVRTRLEQFVHFERYLCSILLIIATLITFVQVMMRFVFNAPFSWSEELTLMLLVWFGYLAMPLDIFTDDHAALYFLYNHLSPFTRKVADIFRHILLVWFFAEMIRYGWMITNLNLPKIQPATHVSQGWLYAPLLVGGLLMFLYSALNALMVLFKPISAYKAEQNAVKTIEDLTIERGGSL